VEALKNFAIKNGKNNPEAFEVWICKLKKDRNERAVLKSANKRQQYGYNKLSMPS